MHIQSPQDERAAEARPERQGAERVPAAPLRRLLRPVNLATIIVLFWMSAPVAPLIPNLDSTLAAMFSVQSNGFTMPADPNEELLRLSWLPLYVVMLSMVCARWRLVGRCMTENWPLFLLLAWTCLSVMWSVSPEDTLRRSVALTVSTLFGIYVGARFDALWTLRLLAWSLLIGLAASLVCGIVFRNIAVAQEGAYVGAWRGVYASKNSLGAVSLIAGLAFWVLHMVEQRRRHLAALCLAALLLLLSTAKTPLVITLALLPSLPLAQRILRSGQRPGLLLSLTGCGVALAIIFGAIMLAPLLSLFNRDVTLTGRTYIWSLSWDAIQPKFWAGYGYGAFWANPHGPATEIWDSLNWRAPSSHSGVLELWLALGFVGVALFGSLVVRTFVEIAAHAGIAGRGRFLWFVGYFLIFMIYLLSEPSSMEQNSLSWVLFVAIATAASETGRRAAEEAHVRAPAPWASCVVRPTPHRRDLARKTEGGAIGPMPKRSQEIGAPRHVLHR